LSVVDGIGPFFLQAGRPQDQQAIGSTRAGGSLSLGSTTHATKGPIALGNATYLEAQRLFGNVANPLAPLHIAGHLRLDNSADAGGIALQVDTVASAPRGTPIGSVRLLIGGVPYLTPVFAASQSQAAAAVTAQDRTIRFRWQVLAAEVG
jgi:hypothetical protein